MIEPESGTTRTIIQLVTTVDTREAADSIAHKLVSARLAGCVQIGGPICSTYSWKGAVEQSMEFRLTIKTTVPKLQDLLASLKQLHPYNTPELLWTEAYSTVSYYNWLCDYLDSN